MIRAPSRAPQTLFGNTPTGILITFDLGVIGVGADIQSDVYSPFRHTISLFDRNSNFLGSYTAKGAVRPRRSRLRIVLTWTVTSLFGCERKSA